MPERVVLRLALVLCLLAPLAAGAQRALQPWGLLAAQPRTSNPASTAFQPSGGMPRWAKWGLVGAVAGGALFAVAGQSNVDGGHSAAGDALAGAAAGFAVIGGGVALYDAMCAGDTRSRRSGLCGR
jgi:hypothetical protein